MADDQSLWDVPTLWWRNALSLLIGFGLLIALVWFTKARWARAWMLGLAHFIAHIAAMIATIWAVSWAASWAVSRLFEGMDGGWHVALTLLGTVVVYGVIGTELFALYLLVADLFRVNRTLARFVTNDPIDVFVRPRNRSSPSRSCNCLTAIRRPESPQTANSGEVGRFDCGTSVIRPSCAQLKGPARWRRQVR